MVFSKKDKQIIPSYHNRPLYAAAFVHDVEQRRTLIDPRSSLNIMPPSSLEVVGIPQVRVVKQLIEVSSFGGSESFTLGYINVDLTIGLI